MNINCACAKKKIPTEQFDQYTKLLYALKQKNRLEDVIGDVTNLKSEQGTKIGRCTFCGKQTLRVNSVRQVFHCFDCGKGGDLFMFVMQHYKVDFNGAVEFLKKRCGL